MSITSIVLGTRVVVLDLLSRQRRSYRIVTPDASDPLKGHISPTTPVAQALLGRSPGDEVSVRTPGGIRRLQVLECHD